VFYSRGDRHDRHHNRIRFLIEKTGFDEFRNLYESEFRRLKEEEHISLRPVEFQEGKGGHGEPAHSEDEEYGAFLKYGVRPQKQKGYCSVMLRIPRGDIKAETLSAFAGLEKDFHDLEFRTTQNQNLVLTWIPGKDIFELYGFIKKILDDFLYPETLLDVVCCKGALTCNLGFCNSPGLAEEIEKFVKKDFIGTEALDKLSVRLNGCPNACGRHPVGKLAFYGMVRKVDGRPVPFYRFLIGGRKAAEKTKLARETGLLPAKNVPSFLKEFLEKSAGKTGEDVNLFLDGPAHEIAKGIFPKYSYVPPYLENRDFYIDWGKEEEFSLEGLAGGECGAGVLDMIEADLAEAKIALEGAEKNPDKAEELKKALFFSARALLIVKGKDPRTEGEIFQIFKEIFIEPGLLPEEYASLQDVYNSLENVADKKGDPYNFARNFYLKIKELYESMDSSFNFPKKEETKAETLKARAVYDLKGTPCPINYVKVKLYMEQLKSGDVLDVFLDEGEPIQNVPKSLEADGHKILKIEKRNGFYSVLVQKKQEKCQ
ncbi:MAG TPA: sulfurtransferase TusA family protein, partial [bacterium]|nr:sulfurtransferase TusA family protein [bacterium]